MAHHGSTPLSVLAAPLLEPRWVHEHTGPNRFARRHFFTKTGALRTIPKALRQPATNVPYVKPKRRAK